MSKWDTCHSLHTLLYCLNIYQGHILSSKKSLSIRIKLHCFIKQKEPEWSKKESQWFPSLILLPSFFSVNDPVPWPQLSHNGPKFEYSVMCSLMNPHLPIWPLSEHHNVEVLWAPKIQYVQTYNTAPPPVFSEKYTRFKPAMPIQWPCHLWREEMLQLLLPTLCLNLTYLPSGFLGLLRGFALVRTSQQCSHIRSHHSMGNRWRNSGNSARLYFWGLQKHCRWWLQPWN